VVPGLNRKDLISLKELNNEDIEEILERGAYWAEKTNSRISYSPKVLDNPIICNLFFESSTRTRFSFEVAGKKLGYHVLNFYPNSSSTQKGESLYDTLKTLESMGIRVAIIRTSEEMLLQDISDKLSLSIINAGAGSNEHPTQGLLDLLTIKNHFNRIEGLKVAIIGDIKHSRVANSNIIALNKFKAEILLSGPPELLPDPSQIEAKLDFVDPDTAVREADVVIMLRLQRERHKEIKSFDTYFQDYGLNLERFSLMKPESVIMHPAPFNRNTEIDDSLIEHPRSLIFKQVEFGVAIRMAVLERALK
jgi:aspartate carbamoyltransferase catalytic subunit